MSVASTAVLHSFFFFQAEDGIRDVAVTGVQTCALPISRGPDIAPAARRGSDRIVRARDAERAVRSAAAPIGGGGGGARRSDARPAAGPRPFPPRPPRHRPRRGGPGTGGGGKPPPNTLHPPAAPGQPPTP